MLLVIGYTLYSSTSVTYHKVLGLTSAFECQHLQDSVVTSLKCDGMFDNIVIETTAV